MKMEKIKSVTIKDLPNEKLDVMCSHCFKKYSFSSLMTLEKKEVKKGQKDFGYCPVCTCGKKFHVDKWNIQTEINTMEDTFLKFLFLDFLFANILVSTVCLEFNHFGNYYETMVFVKKKRFSIFNNIPTDSFYDRYPTKTKAKMGHNEIVKIVKKSMKDFKYFRNKKLEV